MSLKLILQSRLSGQLVPWRGSGGEPRSSVVCRASYRFAPGSVVPLDEAPRARGAEAPFKSATDIVVVGRSDDGAPGRLEVGDVDKKVVAADGQLKGVGPLGAESAGRRRWLGPHTDWQEAQLAERGFPGDADWRYWNVAPIDQQLSRPLAPDESIVLAAPGKPALTTRLCGERALAYSASQATATEAEAIEMLADTLFIDLDRGLCVVSWRGQVDPSANGVLFVALGKGDEDFATIRQRTRTAAVPLSARTAERAVAARPAEALPFMAQPTGDSIPPSPLTSSNEARVSTGTVGAEELKAAMMNLTAEQRESAPWLAPPRNPSPSESGVPSEGGSAPWSKLPPSIAQRPSAPPPPPARRSVPPVDVPPKAPAPIGVAPAPSPAPPPRAVLSAATFAAASVAPPVRREEPAESPPREEPPPAAAAIRTENTQLIWYDPDSVERVRAFFPDLIDELDFVEPDPKRDITAEDGTEAKAHHHCFGVLSRGRPGGSRSLYEAFDDASVDGAFVAPIVLVEGDLRPSFDAVARVERLVALLEPLALGDDKLQSELKQIGKLLESPYSLRVGGTADRVSRQLEQLFMPKHRAVVEGIDDKVERLLLEDRAFASRKVLGAPHLRATITFGDADEAVVAYLPEDVADELPLFTSFRCRVLAEVHPPQDGSESHALALSVVALGRLVRRQDGTRWGQARR